MTAKQLQAFHQSRFCECGRKATRVVEGIGFCSRHLAKATAAAERQSVIVDSMRAADEFQFDTSRCVKRHYGYGARR